MEYKENDYDERQKRLEKIIRKEFYANEDVVEYCEDIIKGGVISKNYCQFEGCCNCFKCEYIVLIINEYIQKECILDNYVEGYKHLYENIDKFENKISNKFDIDDIVWNQILKMTINTKEDSKRNCNYVHKNTQNSEIKNYNDQNRNNNNRNVRNTNHKIESKYIFNINFKDKDENNKETDSIEMEVYTISVILKIKSKLLKSSPTLKNIINALSYYDDNYYYINNRIGIIEKIKKKIYDYCFKNTKNKQNEIKYMNTEDHVLNNKIGLNAFAKNDDSYLYDNVNYENGFHDFTNFNIQNNNDKSVHPDHNRNEEDLFNAKYYSNTINNWENNKYYNKNNINSSDKNIMDNINNSDLSFNKKEEYNHDIFFDNDVEQKYNRVVKKKERGFKIYEINIRSDKNLTSLKSIITLIEMINVAYLYFIKCVKDMKKKEKSKNFENDQNDDNNFFCDEKYYEFFYNMISGYLSNNIEKKNNSLKKIRKKKAQSASSCYSDNQKEEHSLFSDKDSNKIYDKGCESESIKDIDSVFDADISISEEIKYASDEENSNASVIKLNDDNKIRDGSCSINQEEHLIIHNGCEISNILNDKEIYNVIEYIKHIIMSIIKECDGYFNIEYLYTLHIFELKLFFNILKKKILRRSIQDDFLIMLTYCGFKLQNDEIINFCFWRIISIFDDGNVPNCWEIMKNVNKCSSEYTEVAGNILRKKYIEFKNNVKEITKKNEKKNVIESCNTIFYEALNLIPKVENNKKYLSEIDINNGSFYFKKNLIDKNVFLNLIKNAKHEFNCYNNIEKGYVINVIERIRNFNDYYSCCYILKNNKKKTLMGFKKRGENKVYIYKYDKKIKNIYKHVEKNTVISGFLGVLICNFIGMKISIYDNGIDKKYSNFFPNFERKNVITIKFESNIISELPRHFICNIYKEDKSVKFIYENKCPTWNEEKEIYELPFYGRVRLASAKNLQLILKKCLISNSKKALFSNTTINDLIDYMSTERNNQILEYSETPNDKESNVNIAFSKISDEYDWSAGIAFKAKKNGNNNNNNNRENNGNNDGIQNEEGEKSIIKKFPFDVIKNNFKIKKYEKFEIINNDQDEIFLIFGKNSKDYFTLDYRHPLSSFEAFSIAISSLLKKKAVS
ncbi:conserved Plasmodium protein, unknown function [Plasmodium berghei]|uniref:Tubby C-terminal domain-containing protein n=1 Tax=Plasmodium berghei TaxID=5821 RepID=A0A0Y9XDJ8_PLABE|nr:conserved Plasmodium protein, unknown function [Plasmodium berghei]SCM18032.1 conserved Plasmodium protein, unknown function [Plasmodium berghei]